MAKADSVFWKGVPTEKRVEVGLQRLPTGNSFHTSIWDWKVYSDQIR